MADLMCARCFVKITDEAAAVPGRALVVCPRCRARLQKQLPQKPEEEPSDEPSRQNDP